MKRLDYPKIAVALVWVVSFFVSLSILLCKRHGWVVANGGVTTDPIDKLIGKFVEYYATFIATAGALLAKGAAPAKTKAAKTGFGELSFWIALSASILFNSCVLSVFREPTIQAADREFELIVGISSCVVGPLVVLFFGTKRAP